MNTFPLSHDMISAILSRFGLENEQVTDFCNSSHGDDDIRWNFMLNSRYVLKVNAQRSMWEARLQEISRLIARYRSIGLYVPALIPTLDGSLSCTWDIQGAPYTCFVEEFAKYPAYTWDAEPDRKEVVEHLGLLAAKYTNVDLSSTRSMWSIIDLAPLDVDVDEKQENADMLAEALRENGFSALAEQVTAHNLMLRETIQADFAALPRCVFQGDLNNSNELHNNGHFVGLIDFNCSGTDVNINVFLNETNWFPDEKDFDRMSIAEILKRMNMEQTDMLSVILQHYRMNELEKRLFPCFQHIADLFQYPNVCQMVKWLGNAQRREKCIAFIDALIRRELHPHA